MEETDLGLKDVTKILDLIRRPRKFSTGMRTSLLKALQIIFLSQYNDCKSYIREVRGGREQSPFFKRSQEEVIH